MKNVKLPMPHAEIEKLVGQLALTYARDRGSADHDDVRQEGWLAALVAASKYDPSCGPPRPYLTVAIDRAMRRLYVRTRVPTSGHMHRLAEATRRARAVPIPAEAEGRSSTYGHSSPAPAAVRDRDCYVAPAPTPEDAVAAAAWEAVVRERLAGHGCGAAELLAAMTPGAPRAEASTKRARSEARRAIRGDGLLAQLLAEAP